MSEDLMDPYIQDLISKAGQARASLWSALGTVFGLLISAASILAAVSKPVWWLLLPILLTNFAGIMAVVRCFRLMHKGHLEVIESLLRPDTRSDDQKVQQMLDELKRPDPINRSESFATAMLWFSTILFFAQAIKTLFWSCTP